MNDVIQEVPISQMEIDPRQPRKQLGDLEGLKQSIQRYGILQPPVVTPVGSDRYLVLAGERRFTAARELGLPCITVVVRSVQEEERAYLQLVENLQREDLDPFEQAGVFRRLIEEYGISEEELGSRVGKSQDYVSRALTIADGIPEAIREEFYATSRKVSPSMLLEIARADSLPKQLRMWQRAKESHYTVKQARAERGGDKGQGKEDQHLQRPRREVIRLDSATVSVQCKKSVSGEEIVTILQDAAKYWQQKLALHRLKVDP